MKLVGCRASSRDIASARRVGLGKPCSSPAPVLSLELAGIAFNWLSPALVEDDLRDYDDHLNDLWRPRPPRMIMARLDNTLGEAGTPTLFQAVGL